MKTRREQSGHLTESEQIDLARGVDLLPGRGLHLDACEPCRREQAEVAGLVESLRSGALPEPPAALVARAVALFPARPSLVERVTEFLARLVPAAGGPVLAPAGVRASATASARQAFEGAGLSVELEVRSEAGGRRVTGQAFASTDRALPLLVRAEASGRILAEAPVSEHGLFSLDRLPGDEFDLVIDTGEARLRIARPGVAPAGD